MSSPNYKPTTAVAARRNMKERPPHPLDAAFAAVGLSREMVDDFPTPAWAVRAWFEHVVGPRAGAIPQFDMLKLVERAPLIWEPAANRGYLVRGLRDYAPRLVCSDIFDYGAGFPTFNFLDLATALMTGPRPDFLAEWPDWIVTNPPFSRAEEFIKTAMGVAKVGVAMLTRVQIIESGVRYRGLFRDLDPRRWCFSQFADRVPMHEHAMYRGMKSATAYGWLTIWREPRDPFWLLERRIIPPCRAELERPGDYAGPFLGGIVTERPKTPKDQDQLELTDA